MNGPICRRTDAPAVQDRLLIPDTAGICVLQDLLVFAAKVLGLQDSMVPAECCSGLPGKNGSVRSLGMASHRCFCGQVVVIRSLCGFRMDRKRMHRLVWMLNRAVRWVRRWDRQSRFQGKIDLAFRRNRAPRRVGPAVFPSSGFDKTGGSGFGAPGIAQGLPSAGPVAVNGGAVTDLPYGGLFCLSALPRCICTIQAKLGGIVIAEAVPITGRTIVSQRNLTCLLPVGIGVLRKKRLSK